MTFKIMILMLFSSIAWTKNCNSLLIINNFNKKLDFTISVNQAVIPDLPAIFSLHPHEIIRTRVINLQKEAYILTEYKEKYSGFWGVEIDNDQVKIHGYTSKGLAYSWDKQKIIFCTPEEYSSKGSCL